MIYSFHIFDKTCEQVYVKHLHHQHPSAAATAAAARSTTMAGADHAKLLFGVVFSLYSLSQKLSDRHQKLSYATKDYRVDTLRTLSGLLFVVISSASSSSSNAGPGLPPGLLETVYANLYVPFVVCNPLGSTALYPADEVALLVPSLLSSSSSANMKEGEQDERETKKKEKRRRDLLERETAVGYGGRDHVRGVLMVQGNVLFDAALTQFLTGL